MSSDRRLGALRRVVGLVAVLFTGILAIVGSGGGAVGFPATPPTFNYTPTPTPGVWVGPAEPIVQAGTLVRFEAHVYNMDAPVTYQWHRDGVAIAGATGPSYLLGGAQVSDDGAQFNVVARGANGTAVGSAQLHVSSTPPVVFQDTEFQVANWSVATIASSGNPSFTALRSETGGNPDAYRLIVHRTLAGTSDLQLVHSNQLSVYDPRQSGAVYVIEFAVDCEVVSRSPGVSPNIPQYAVTLEQAGRVYQIGSTLTFCDTVWKTLADASVTAGASKQLTGPPCSATEMCPDLSADGAPLRFGLFTEARTASGSVEGTMQLGFDNWKVSVWRR